MIAHVSGEVVEKTNASLIIDVVGVGYEVLVSAPDFERVNVNTTVKLYTHDHIRENSHELFGFLHLSAKRLFEMLISVSGVGPKMALAILSLGEPEMIRFAIASGDNAFLQRASGVGKRLVERVVVDLRDKVGLAVEVNTAATGNASNDDALDALLALGFNIQQATEALNQVDKSLDAGTRVKQALKKI